MKAFGPLMIMAEYADREQKEKLKTPFETEPASIASVYYARGKDNLWRQPCERQTSTKGPYVGSLFAQKYHILFHW